MKKEISTCDIKNRKHSGKVETLTIAVIFDHDQEDGRSKCSPYLDTVKIELCSGCKKHMLESRTYIYAYGAMGHNEYTL